MGSETHSQHWDDVYSRRAADQLSWYQRQPQPSLEWIQRLAPERSTRILDVGGGTSQLVETLLDCGYSDLTVLDVSAPALAMSRQRLAERAAAARWIVADILADKLPPPAFDLWHDRAVFHFLVELADRQRYVSQLQRSLRHGGLLILATFAEDGPERCSGLPVQRHSVDSLRQALADGLKLLEQQRVSHLTPGGIEQKLLYTAWQAKPQSGLTAQTSTCRMPQSPEVPQALAHLDGVPPNS
jgi:SAM-dependent methyltransferase